jgi:hypothetical protein
VAVYHKDLEHLAGRSDVDVGMERTAGHDLQGPAMHGGSCPADAGAPCRILCLDCGDAHATSNAPRGTSRALSARGTTTRSCRSPPRVPPQAPRSWRGVLGGIRLGTHTLGSIIAGTWSWRGAKGEGDAPRLERGVGQSQSTLALNDLAHWSIAVQRTLLRQREYHLGL